MPDATHPCPTGSPAPATRPLRVEIDPATGRLTLAPAEATRVALALTHLAAFAQWSPTASAADEAVASDAAWMAETLGDLARAGASS